MSLLDLSQEATDQGCLHIALVPVADVGVPLFEAVSKKLEAMAPIQLTEPKGVVLFPKFIRASELPAWARDGQKWSEFCAHKQIVGVLGLAQCTGSDDPLSITMGFKTAQSKFKAAIESKCLVYGPQKVTNSNFECKKGFSLIDCKLEGDIYEAIDDTELNTQQLEETVTDFALAIYISIKSRIEHVKKYVYQSSGGKSEQVQLLRSPFESQEFGHHHRTEHDDTFDQQRQLSRSNLLARLDKHLADLHLLAGQLQEATKCYHNSSEQLRSCKDWLWAGAAYEGLGGAVLVMKRCEDTLGLKAQGRTIASSNPLNFFNLRTRTKFPTSSSSSRVSSASDMRRKMTVLGGVASGSGSSLSNGKALSRSSSSRLAGKTPSPEPADSEDSSDTGSFQRAEDMVRQDSLSNYIDSDEEGAFLDMTQSDGGLSMMAEEGEGEERGLVIDERLLQKDFVLQKYSQAIDTFKKAGSVGWVPHMEALLKFSKYLVTQKQFSLATDTLQRMLKIGNVPSMKMPDKLSLYVAMAAVYRSMSFERKAAMFTHYAARCAASMAVKPEDSLKAYSLLKQCLPSYKLPVDMKRLQDFTGVCVGWPGIQAAVLSDFVNLSRKLGEDLVAVNYACYLLQTLHAHLTPQQMKYLAEMLEKISQDARKHYKANPGYTATAQLTSPLPLTEYPLVTLFEPKPLVLQLSPVKDPHFQPPASSTSGGVGGAETSGSASGPFIYSALQGRRKKRRREVFWVQGDPAEVSMDIANPFPAELRVEKMSAVLEGASVEVYPSSLTLPADSTPQQFVLLCIPQEAGTLTVQGYEATVFGVYNKCSMRIHDNPLIHVVPPLPQMRVRATLCSPGPSPSSSRRASVVGAGEAELLDGESCQFEIKLECLQEIPVERVKLKLANGNDDFCKFSWDSASLSSLVPVSKGQTSSFLVTISACIPHWFRLLHDQLVTGLSKPAYFSYRNSQTSASQTAGGANFRSFESPPTAGSDGGNFQFSPHSSTSFDSSSPSPNLSPVARRPRHQTSIQIVPKQRKSSTSSDGSSQPGIPTTPLMESLNLAHPAVSNQLKRHSKSATLPHSGRSSPSDSPMRSSTLQRTPKASRKNIIGTASDDLRALEYDKMFFPDDKRASIRSDPGDRGNPSRHSARSKRQKLASSGLDVVVSKPMAVPRNEARLADQFGGSPILETAGVRSSSSSGDQTELSRPSFQGRFISPLARGATTRSQPATSTSKKPLISNPMGPLFKEVPRPPAETRVVGRLVFEYSGGPGGAVGYNRTTEASLAVLVRPVLVFDQFEVSGIEGSPELFELKLVVHNISDRKLEVTIKINQAGLLESGGKPERTLTLDPNADLRFKLAIKRFALPQNTELQNETKPYCDKIVEMVGVHWWEAERGGGSRRNGVVSLEGLRLPLSNLSLMKPVPLIFKFSVNGVTHASYSAHIGELKVGAPINAHLHVTNSSGHVMPPSYLALEPYMFSPQQKCIVKDLSGKLVFSGSLFTRLPELAPEQTHKHHLSMTFLHQGTFHMDVKYLALEDEPSHSRPAVTTVVSNGDPSSSGTVVAGASSSEAENISATDVASTGVSTSASNETDGGGASRLAASTPKNLTQDAPGYIRKWKATSESSTPLQTNHLSPGSLEKQPPSPSSISSSSSPSSSSHIPTSPEGGDSASASPSSPDHRAITKGKGSVRNRIAAIEKLNKSPDALQVIGGRTSPGGLSPSHMTSRQPEASRQLSPHLEEQELEEGKLTQSSCEAGNVKLESFPEQILAKKGVAPSPFLSHKCARLLGSHPFVASAPPRSPITALTPSHLHTPPSSTDSSKVRGAMPAPQKVFLQTKEDIKVLRTDSLSARIQLLTQRKVLPPVSGPYITFNVV